MNAEHGTGGPGNGDSGSHQCRCGRSIEDCIPDPASVRAARVEGARLAARTLRHYLNNRLALTVGYMEIIEDTPELPESARDLARKAIEGARSASGIIRSLQQVDSIDLDPDWIGEPILDLSRIKLEPGNRS